MAEIGMSDVSKIIGEITQAGEKDRRQQSRRRGRIYRDGGKEYLIEHITKEFGKQAVDEMRLAPINALKSWVDRKSIIYARPPMRSAEGNDQALMDYYVDVMGLNVIMAQANRYYNLYSNCELYVIPKNKRGGRCPWVHVMAPFLYSVVPNGFDRTIKEVLVFSSFSDDNDLTRKEIQSVGSIQAEKSVKSQGDLVESNEATYMQHTGYIFWTDNQHFTVSPEGMVLVDPMNPEMLNPLGIIPSVTLRKEVDNEFYASQGEEMVDMAMATQLALTDLLSIAKMQGFSVMVFTGPERPQKAEIGLTKSVWLKTQEGQPTPTMQYVQASSPLDQYTALVDRTLEISSTTNLLPSNIFSGHGSSTSGEHELMKSAATMMEIESQKPVLRDAELECWQLIKNWHNLLFDKNELPPEARALGKFSDTFSPNIIYQDMKPIESDEQRITQVERMDALGVLSKQDKFKKLFPEMTQEQIEAKIKEIDDEKQKSMQMFSLPPVNGSSQDDEVEEQQEEKEELDDDSNKV